MFILEWIVTGTLLLLITLPSMVFTYSVVGQFLFFATEGLIGWGEGRDIIPAGIYGSEDIDNGPAVKLWVPFTATFAQMITFIASMGITTKYYPELLNENGRVIAPQNLPQDIVLGVHSLSGDITPVVLVITSLLAAYYGLRVWSQVYRKVEEKLNA